MEGITYATMLLSPLCKGNKERYCEINKLGRDEMKFKRDKPTGRWFSEENPLFRYVRYEGQLRKKFKH